MIKSIAIVTLIIGFAALSGCKTDKNASKELTETTPIEAVEGETIGGQNTVGMIPKAVVYKMNGDYADNVPVTVNTDGTAIVSYPAPSDLTPYSTPLPLTDGYYLDRRGIGPNTRFTRYTYEEYRALGSAPSPNELLESVIPDARVIDIHRLPITLNEAQNDTIKVNQLIKSF